MCEKLLFTVSVLFFYKELSGLFLFIRNVLNQIRDTAIKVLADSVKVFNVQTFGHFVVDVVYRRGSYSGLTSINVINLKQL